MEPLAWKVLSGFDGEGLAAFLTLTGSVAFVVVGIPTMMVGWGRGLVGRLASFSALLHGVLLVMGPTLLLLPLHGIHPSATFLVGILYAAMLMIRMLTERGSDQDRLMRVASPWLLGVVAELASWLLGGAPAWGLTLVGVALEVSLVSYVSFWIAFPFFFFAGKASGEQLELLPGGQRCMP